MNETMPAVIEEQHPIEVPPLQPTPRPLALPTTAFDKLTDAVAAVMKELMPVVKRGKNQFQNYSFPRMQDVLQVLTPLMSKHGIVIMQSEIERGLMDKGGAIFATYDFTIMHKSGQVWPERQRQTGVSRTRDSKGGFDDKALNKCHTAARKFFLMSLFQMPTEDVGEGKQRPQRPAPAIEQPATIGLLPDVPLAINRGDGEWQDWTRVFLKMVNAAPDIDTCELWLTKNSDTLNQLSNELETHHQFVMREFNKRIRKLAPDEAPK